jgi:hypothetical protein
MTMTTNKPRTSTQPLEGRVIAHSGTTLGCEPDNADNPAVRAAHTVLTDNGFTPVTVNNEFDPEPGDGTTGFYIEPRDTASGPCVYIHDTLNGNLTWRRDANSKLNAYAKALTDAGWTVESGTSKVIRAYPPTAPAEPVQDAVVAELEQEPTDEPVNFDDVQVGDELTFCNRDNGFGGSGERIIRAGVVTGKTAKTVTVEITGNNPLAVPTFTLNSSGRGKDVTYGRTARLRAATWNDRQVRRTKKVAPAPAESGPFGIFEVDVCIDRAEDATKGAQTIDRYRKANPGVEYRLIPLCPEHFEYDAPRDTCEDCTEQTRTPYTADHVAYVHEAGEVTALYIPDPEHAKDPKGTWAKCRDIAWWRASGVECIATLVRDGRRWNVEGSAHDAFPDSNNGAATKREAMEGLRRVVAEHFNH